VHARTLKLNGSYVGFKNVKEAKHMFIRWLEAVEHPITIIIINRIIYKKTGTAARTSVWWRKCFFHGCKEGIKKSNFYEVILMSLNI
jgi:hypothetical protein